MITKKKATLSPKSFRMRGRDIKNFQPHRYSNGRTIFVVDAHRGDGKRFVVRADEKLTAFLELERVTKAA